MRQLSFIFLFIIFLVGFHSCENDRNDDTSRIQLKLVDEPGDYLEVNVEIIDIQYKSSEDGEWSSFNSQNGYPINVDLTELVSGNDLLLVDEVLPSGMLHQIRLVLSDNNFLVIEGENGEALEPIHLSTPSAQQSGLKLYLNEDLEPGFSYTFILDWVVGESIVEAGNSGNYILKPVIRVNAEVNSGSVRGTVVETIEGSQVPLENVIVEIYTLEDIFITDTLTDENGSFLVQGLDEGSYKIKISQTGYELYESSEIIVSTGEVNEVGTIELIPVE